MASEPGDMAQRGGRQWIWAWEIKRGLAWGRKASSYLEQNPQVQHYVEIAQIRKLESGRERAVLRELEFEGNGEHTFWNIWDLQVEPQAQRSACVFHVERFTALAIQEVSEQRSHCLPYSN